MIGKERVHAAIAHRQADAVPFDPYLSPGHVVRRRGRKLHEVYTVPGLLVSAVIESYRAYHADWVTARGDLYRGDSFDFVERKGTICLKDKGTGEITHHLTPDEFAEVPETDLPYTLIDYRRIPKIHTEADLERLTITPKAALLSLRFFQSIRRYVEELGSEMFVLGAAVGPSMNAIALCRGTEKGLIDLYENVDLCRAIMDWRARQLEEETLALKDLGVDGVVTGDAYATCSLVSPAKYRELLWEYQKRHVDFIHRQNLVAVLHVCGKTNAILEDLAATGADVLETVEAPSTGGDVDLADAKRRVGARSCLKGNLDSKSVIEPGPAERVKEYCFEAMQAAAAGGGFILSTEQITPDTPPEHVLAMHEARMEFYGRAKRGENS